jgi:hypothetical protein
MTRQQIKQMMHESKAIEWFDSENMDWLEYVNVFDRFASLVVAVEREACAKVCEAEAEKWEGKDGPVCFEARLCSYAIRARGKK